VDGRPPEDLFTVGRIAGAWGLKGMVKVVPVTDFPAGLPGKEEVWLWASASGARRFRIREGRPANRHVILGLEGVDDAAAAEALRGHLVMVDREHLEKLAPGVYYHHQIIGLAVLLPGGEKLGRVEEIWPTGAGDVWVVREAGREWLLPAVDDFIGPIDLEGGAVTLMKAPAGEEKG
jgi:16S rRNA processing protein RimM